jgi:hypothetical protein
VVPAITARSSACLRAAGAHVLGERAHVLLELEGALAFLSADHAAEQVAEEVNGRGESARAVGLPCLVHAVRQR